MRLGFNFKSLLLAVVFTASLGQVEAKKVDTSQFPTLRAIEDTMVAFGDSMIFGSSVDVRATYAYDLVRLIKSVNLIEGNFFYPFERVQSFSILKSPDAKFRTWTLKLIMGKGTYHYLGAIQLAPKRKKPTRLIPLIDGSIAMQNASQIIGDNQNWFGAYYYNILPVKHKRKRYYFLFGWDGNTFFSTKKVVEVMQISKKGEVTFGAPMFGKKTDSGLVTWNRFVLEFKKGAGVTLNYNEEMAQIIFDHLITLNPHTEGMNWTYLPDGSYESFVWDKKKGMWMHNEKVWTRKHIRPPRLAKPPKNSGPDVLPKSSPRN